MPNLLITDGSVLPTQGSANPALTIMAIAARAADRLMAGPDGVRAAGGEDRGPRRSLVGGRCGQRLDQRVWLPEAAGRPWPPAPRPPREAGAPSRVRPEP